MREELRRHVAYWQETLLVNTNLQGFEELLKSYLRQNPSVPGVSFAIARHGRVIYARGFGYSDLERGEPVRPASRFRIASVSKTFTSAAIMVLVQRGLLKLTDYAFPLLKLQVPFHEKAPLDGRLNSITIKKLFPRPSEAGTTSNCVDLPAFYAYGWHVDFTVPRGKSEWHDGLFSGTSSFLMRRTDGIVWALVFNTDNDAGPVRGDCSPDQLTS